MTIVHVPEMTYHRIMNLVDQENPQIPDPQLVIKTRERIVEVLNKYAEGT